MIWIGRGCYKYALNYSGKQDTPPGQAGGRKQEVGGSVTEGQTETTEKVGLKQSAKNIFRTLRLPTNP